MTEQPTDANGQSLPAGPQGPDEGQIAADAAAKIADAAARPAQTSDGPADIPLAGTTDIDVEGLLRAALQQLNAQQQQINSLLASQGPRGPHPLASVARMLRHHLADGEHRDAHQPAVQLADDLVDASANAVQSGDLTSVRKISAGLLRWLDRNPVPPGDSYHHRQAADIIRWHLPDQVDAFVPAPSQPGIGSSQAPARVVPGSVTG